MSKNQTAGQTATNQFDFITGEAAVTVEGRKLGHTNRLIDLAKEHAATVMRAIAAETDPEQKAQMIEAIDGGDAMSLISLINLTVGEDKIKADSSFLEDCSEDEFSKLLESRRSDRSKKFKAGPRTSVAACQSYIGTMVAEMMVREAWNKPYNQSAGKAGAEVDVNDLEAVGKKIKSLQSKKSRLRKLAEVDDITKAEYEAVVAEIDRLNSYRPTVSKVASIKSAPAEVVREALTKLDISQLDEDLVEQLKVAGLI